MKSVRFLACLLSLVWIIPASTMVSEQADILTGTSSGAETIRLAVPEFTGDAFAGPAEGDLARAFNETLWNDLDFSGVVLLVNRSFYPLGRFREPLDIEVAAWTGPGVDAEFLTFGSASLRADTFVVEARLWDLKTQFQDRETISLRLSTAATEPAVRLMAHQYADRIVDALGGGRRGVFQTKIAFESTRTTPADAARVKEIFVMDYDGYNQYQLTTHMDLAVTPSWSPDGSRIGYTRTIGDQTDVALISPLDRRGFPFPEFENTNTTPSWSSDGTRIAYASSKGTFDIELYIYDTRTGTESRLTNSRGVDMSPAWNPATNAQIAFMSDRLGTPQIFLIDAEGGNLRRIETRGGEATSPSWSPDGQTIAFGWLNPETSSRDIYIYNVATRRISQLTQNAGENDNPTWSPDGRHLAFESTRSGSSQIYSMLANGTRVRQLTSVGNNQNPAWSSYMGR